MNLPVFSLICPLTSSFVPLWLKDTIFSQFSETQEYWFCVLTSGRAWERSPRSSEGRGPDCGEAAEAAVPPAGLASSLGCSWPPLPSRPAAACSPGVERQEQPRLAARSSRRTRAPRAHPLTSERLPAAPSGGGRRTRGAAGRVSLRRCRLEGAGWSCKQNPTPASGAPRRSLPDPLLPPSRGPLRSHLAAPTAAPCTPG